MKKIFKPIIIAAVILSFSACKKSFLAENPYSFLSSTDIYGTDAGVNAALNGCWAQLAGYGGFGAGYITVTTVGGGGFYTSQGPANELNGLTMTPSSIWMDNNTPYQSFFSAINTANDILANTPDGNASATVKKRVLAEAHFLRGMLYFDLVRLYGGVPLRTEPSNANNIDVPRATAQQVYALIVQDLEYAKNNMPEPGSQAVGRPHKYAANAMLGKVYMTLAGNDQTSTYWQKAKDEFLQVYGKYSLISNMASLFNSQNENSAESIIEIQYGINGDPNGQLTNFFSPGGSTFTPKATNGPFGRIRVNKEIFDKHRTQYPTDPRIDASYIYTQFTRNAGGVTKIYPDNKAAQGWPYIKKFVDPDYVATNSNRNYIYLRYAEVLLSLAECENEINGPANAYQYVNAVLARARTKADGTFATTPANWAGMDQATFRDRILQERRYELIGEGQLWFDLRRRGESALLKYLTEHNTSPSFATGFDVAYPLNRVRTLMLLPIPATEINASAAISPADQNPGY